MSSAHAAQPTASPNAERPNGTSHGVPLLDAKGAAKLLNVPRSWVLAEARADRIPHLRLGRYVRFEAHELEVWWQSRRRGPRRAGSGPAQAHGRSA